MESLALVVVALSILAFGLISGRVQKSVITPPIVFVVIGLLVSQTGLGLLKFDIGNQAIHLLAEITLVLVLFTDAARIDLRALRHEHDLPVRLLSFGLPMTIIFGTLVATILFKNLPLWESMILAIILAPTDAALGQAVVGSPLVPVRIRQALNVESGLNDGLVLPALLITLSLATTEPGESAGFWVQFIALQLLLGPMVGIGVGYIGGKLVELGGRSGWMNHTFQDLSALGLALLAFAGADLVGGNGFIAAFCAGLTLGNCSRAICECLYEFAEAEGQLLTLVIFMIFGAVMAPMVIDHLTWQTVLYGLMSLTVIRLVPVATSLLGARLQWDTVLFLGWFGPRGLASILFALLVVEDSSLPGREMILVTVVVTVLFSIFAHGLTAYPGAKWYSRRVQRFGQKPGAGETLPVSEMPVRLPYHE